MKHFTTVEWIDLVNQAVSPSQKVAMEKHLDDCKSCAREFLRWLRIRQSAASEASYQPPEDAVRIAKAAFAGSEWARKAKPETGVLQLLFDSFLQPALAGVRSAGTGTRRMLYGADPFQIDLQIEAQTGGRTIAVTGQLLDSRHPEGVGRDVPLMLSNLRGGVIQASTNQFGEFRAEIENSGDLELVFHSENEEPIVISLRHALNGLREEKP
ncbi:MAG TPA: hypothetical protein VEV41_11395 [Terriglobales bacterium]|nr:hypothetical protein [Terriglobales bacterium]